MRQDEFPIVDKLDKDSINEVLDKIRAEIDNMLSDGMIHKQTVLGIIDMHKSESDPQESEDKE